MSKVYEYQVSERSVLKRGTPFKATQGPYFLADNGEHISMADKGPFVFMWAEESKDITLIHALDRDGFHSLLHIKGERKSVVEGLVPRPYVIKNRVTKHLHKVKGLRTKLLKVKKERKKK